MKLGGFVRAEDTHMMIGGAIAVVQNYEKGENGEGRGGLDPGHEPVPQRAWDVENDRASHGLAPVLEQVRTGQLRHA